MGKKREVTLREHLASIASAGGKARAASLSEKAKTKHAKKAGALGGAARAAAIGPRKRSAIAKKAVEARWAKERGE